MALNWILIQTNLLLKKFFLKNNWGNLHMDYVQADQGDIAGLVPLK